MAEQSNGLMGSVKRLFATLTGILATRLELLSNELQEERLFWSRMILMWVVALFCACVAILLLTAFIVVAFWDESRLAVLGTLSAFFFVLAGLVAYSIRTKSRAKSKLFSASLAELAKDQDQLGT
ncbi:MAG: phage holin family protein [Gallionella sp.]|nr:phage holin family protein [Gallionella sp.]